MLTRYPNMKLPLLEAMMVVNSIRFTTPKLFPILVKEVIDKAKHEANQILTVKERKESIRNDILDWSTDDTSEE